MEGQRAAIEKFAELEGLDIVDWFQDAASAMGEDSISRREGLKRAFEQGRRRGCPIIVDGIDRLSRDAKTTERIILEENVQIITTEGLTSESLALRARAARAEIEGRAIGQRTKEALRRKKAEGVRLGNTKNLDQAQKAGAAGNRARSAAKAEEIADHLEGLSGLEAMSAKQIADSLNAAGISTRTGRPWSTGALRRPLAAAHEILVVRREASDEMRRLPGFGRF